MEENKQKYASCKLINRDTNILLLDEPTQPSGCRCQRLPEKALQEYRGSILLICHEPEFYQDVVNEVWDMSKWTDKSILKGTPIINDEYTLKSSNVIKLAIKL